jgi:hypothetical protein
MNAHVKVNVGNKERERKLKHENKKKSECILRHVKKREKIYNNMYKKIITSTTVDM